MQFESDRGEIRNCTRAIAIGGLSSFLRTRVAAEAMDLETRCRDLAEKLVSSEPRAIKLWLCDARWFVESRLENLQSMLSGEPRLAGQRSRSTFRKSG
jgi:hypothetical protein